MGSRRSSWFGRKCIEALAVISPGKAAEAQGEGQRLRLLVAFAAEIDAALEIQEPRRARVDSRITGGNTSHALRRVAVAGGAGSPARSRRLAPELCPPRYPQHAGIGKVVRLQFSQIVADKLGAGFQRARTLGIRCNCRGNREQEAQERRYEACKVHGTAAPGAAVPDRPGQSVTEIAARSAPRSPASSTQENSTSPLRVATT